MEHTNKLDKAMNIDAMWINIDVYIDVTIVILQSCCTKGQG